MDVSFYKGQGGMGLSIVAAKVGFKFQMLKNARLSRWVVIVWVSWMLICLFPACNLQGAGQDKLGIYIKQVVKDGPAANVNDL